VNALHCFHGPAFLRFRAEHDSSFLSAFFLAFNNPCKLTPRDRRFASRPAGCGSDTGIILQKALRH
jgi:hypothetical protein